jgi:hypothetical protein
MSPSKRLNVNEKKSLTSSRKNSIPLSTKLKREMVLRISSTFLIPFSANKVSTLQQYVEFTMPVAGLTKISLYSKEYRYVRELPQPKRKPDKKYFRKRTTLACLKVFCLPTLWKRKKSNNNILGSVLKIAQLPRDL